MTCGIAIGVNAIESSTHPDFGAARSAIQAITKVSATTRVADIAASDTLVFTALRKIG